MITVPLATQRERLPSDISVLKQVLVVELRVFPRRARCTANGVSAGFICTRKLTSGLISGF